MSRVSAAEHTVIGGLAGSIEVSLMQPMVGVKNALQEGRPLPRTAQHLYRGLGVNVLSMAPVTATQFGSKRACQLLSSSLGVAEDSAVSQIACSSVAGAVSGVVATPAELVVILQQKSGRSMASQVESFVEQYGIRPLFTRGLGMAVSREAIYAGGYLGLFPVLQSYLESRSDMKGYPVGTSTLAAGLVSGLAGSFFSQPFDTIKTRQQAFMYSRPEYRSSWDALKTLLREGGPATLWKGYLPRGIRVICALFVLNATRDAMVEYLDGERLPSAQVLPVETAVLEGVVS